MNITFLDAYTVNPGDLSWDAFEGFGKLTTYDRTDDADIVERAADADIVIVNKARLTEDVFAKLPKLKLVCEAATGYDNIDLEAARRHGVVVCNCAGYSSRAVAQLTASLILEVTDAVGDYALANKNGAWSRAADFCYWKRPRVELVDKRLAIVGYGNIGQAVAGVMRAFGMKVCAVTSKPQEALPADVEKLTLEEAFATCHVVSLNCPLNERNRHFVDAALLAHAHRDLIIVNTARGGLVNDADVAAALHEGRLGAYCTDVMQPEPPRPDNPLLTAPRCFITPHIGWATTEARQRIINIVKNNIQGFLKGKPENVVN